MLPSISFPLSLLRLRASKPEHALYTQDSSRSKRSIARVGHRFPVAACATSSVAPASTRLVPPCISFSTPNLPQWLHQRPDIPRAWHRLRPDKFQTCHPCHRQQGRKPRAVKGGEHYCLSLLVCRFSRLGCFRPSLVSRVEHSVHKRDEYHRETANEGGFGSCGGSERLRLSPEANGIEQADLGGDGKRRGEALAVGKR